MKLIDLSHSYWHDMPVADSVEKPRYSKNGWVKKGDIYQITTIENHVCHIGTHVDCSANMCPNGFYADDKDVNFWVGRGLVIDCTSYPEGSKIGMEAFENVDLEGIEFVLIHFGWDKNWHDKKAFYGNYPVITTEVAKYLGKHRDVRGLGVETNSVDIVNDELQLNHKTFLKYGTTIIECLKNLDQLVNKKFTFMSLPMKIRGAEGSPTRAVAILEDEDRSSHPYLNEEI